MRVLVTGAYGFIGSHIVAALSAAGHEAICAVRQGRLDSRFPGVQAVPCDMARDVTLDAWLPRLHGIDAVVNCAGILREGGEDRYETAHVQSPLALFEACACAGVLRIVQVSALGRTDDGEFIASKHRCDGQLAKLGLNATILRPALVYSVHGSYGGSSLLRAMAAMPAIIPVPDVAMRPCVQPIAAEDVALAVMAALSDPPVGVEILELVGPEPMGLGDYLQGWRRWLGLPGARLLTVPSRWMHLASRIGEWLGRGPLGETMRRMLEHGHLGQPQALPQMRSRLNLVPRTLERAMAEAPSHTQDRWHARLYFALPLLRMTVALLWLASGVIGWWLPRNAIDAATPGGFLPHDAALVVARCTASVDLLLGVLYVLRWRPRWVLVGMLLMLLGYTIGIGMLWPGHWLDPLGGLLKNLPLMAALVLLLATEERR